MENKEHEVFLFAIHNKKKVLVKFNSKEKGIIERKCIPFDYGPSKKYQDNKYRYHFYDLNSPDGSHNLSISTKQIYSLKILDESFDPGTYVTWWPIKWNIPRDWGEYS